MWAVGKFYYASRTGGMTHGDRIDLLTYSAAKRSPGQENFVRYLTIIPKK
jgi:hypothetical protein